MPWIKIYRVNENGLLPLGRDFKINNMGNIQNS